MASDRHGQRRKTGKAEIVQRRHAGGIGLPTGYAALLEDLKQRIRAAQVKAALSANSELIALYWHIGKSIAERQAVEGWGKSVVDRLATDLQRAFPGIEGFSPSNIWRMRAFYLAWSPEVLAQAVRESPGALNLAQAVRDLDPQNRPQVVVEIPWGHNLILIEKLKAPAERLWYARQTIEHGWSRNILALQIESGLHRRQGQAVTNFKDSLPPPQSDLAQEALKDPYVFDFLTLGAEALERELEQGLVDHVQKFLLELGVGFAFVGRQVHIEVDGDDFYIDLLFYHVRMHCFVVLDLKAGAFKPEYAGKMNFYLSAVDDKLRTPGDNPSIGVILCKDKKRLVVEYALRDTKKPIGVSAYLLTERLPDRLKGSLPTVEQLEAELGKPAREDHS